MFDEKTFTLRLKTLRQSKNLTLGQLGESIGSTKATMGNLENANKKPSLEMVTKIADYFGVSIDYLLGRSDNPKINS